jgi:hypothetical protein
VEELRRKLAETSIDLEEEKERYSKTVAKYNREIESRSE